MIFINLNEEKRKNLYKLLSIEKYKKQVAKDQATKVQFIRAVGKEVQRTTKKDLVDYLESTLDDMSINDKVYESICVIIGKEISKKFKYTNEIIKLLKEKSFDDIDEPLKIQLDEYRNEFENCKLPITYDDFIHLNCLPDEKKIMEIAKRKDKKKAEQQEKLIEDLSSQITELKSMNRILKQDIKKEETHTKKVQADLKKEKEKNTQLTKEIKELINELNELKQILSVDNLVIQLNDLIDLSSSKITCKDLINILGQEEERYLIHKDFEKAKKILAAKYAVIILMEAKE